MQHAITTSETLQTELSLLIKNAPVQNKLIALWQLDEHSKLYCQWVTQANK